MRELVEFALDRDVNAEISAQLAILKSEPSTGIVAAKAHLDLGILYYSQGRIKESISEFLFAIESDMGFARAYRKLGEVYVNLGDYESAEWFGRMAAELGDSKLLDALNRHQVLTPVKGSNDAPRVLIGQEPERVS
jgi:tetratricopeptide (TPR) repeat protein